MNINSKQALVSITIFVLTATIASPAVAGAAQLTNEQRTRLKNTIMDHTQKLTNEQRTRLKNTIMDHTQKLRGTPKKSIGVKRKQKVLNRGIDTSGGGLPMDNENHVVQLFTGEVIKDAELLDYEVEMDTSSNHLPESSPENANDSGLGRRSSPLFQHDAGRPDGLTIPNTLDQQGWFADPDELNDKLVVSVNNNSAGASRPGGPVNPIDAGIEIGQIQLDPDTINNSSATSSNNNPTSAPTSSSTISSIGSNARRDSSTIGSSATFWVAISMSAVGAVGLLVVTAKAINYCRRAEDPDTGPIEPEHQIEFQDVA